MEEIQVFVFRMTFISSSEVNVICTAQQKFNTDFIIASSFVRIRNNLFQAINTYGDP